MIPRPTLTGSFRFLLAAGVASVAATASPSARAAEVTRVVSAGDADDAFDFNLTVGFRREAKTARLMREVQSAAGNGATTKTSDLAFSQVRNIVDVRADFGVLPDVGLFFSLPFVVSDERRLDFDRASETCAMAKGLCIDETNSTLLRDRFLPGGSMFGLDAEHERMFNAGSKTVFKGPTRRGLEYLGVGMNWAVLNQEREASKPTWLIRFETRFAITKDQRFDPDAPKANTGVGLGYHQLVFSSLFSRRFRYLDPYLGGFYMLPIAKEESVYKAAAFGQNAFSRPQHRAGLEAGLEGRVWENAPAQQRIVLELRARYEARFLGLAQGELWEVLSGRSLCASDPAACRPDIDTDLDGDGKLDPNPGVTRSPGYGLFGGDVGLGVYAGPHVRFRGLVGLTWEQNRPLTDGGSGQWKYDSPGRRYLVEGGRIFSLWLEGALLF